MTNRKPVPPTQEQGRSAAYACSAARGVQGLGIGPMGRVIFKKLGFCIGPSLAQIFYKKKLAWPNSRHAIFF